MTAPTQAAVSKLHRGRGMLRVIGAFKIAKSLLLIVAAIATLKFMHEDTDQMVLEFAHRLHLAPGNKLVQRALEVSPSQLRLIATVLGLYATMFMIEGVGLLTLQHWAEWMTVVTTAGLIPVEIYEIARGPTAFKIGAFIINIAIVAYLIYLLQKQHNANQLNPS
jgi:uncharacterized membrane protein (DUF2068 family)